MSKNSEILDKTEKYVTQLFKDKLSPKYLYHNYNHTTEVVEIVEEMAKSYDLSDDKTEVLLLASWFHDTGYIEQFDDHEEISKKLAREFLSKEGYEEKQTEQVLKLIESTRYDHKPEDLLEEIIHDADIAHIGRKRFFRKGELLRIELEEFKNEKFSDTEWEKHQLDFLINTPFYTTYAKEKYRKRKANNIKKQRSNIDSAHKTEIRKKTGKDLGRGVDTLYRATYRNHINLSAIADGKANMMISINAIILSVIITLAGSGLTFSGEFFVEHLRFTIPIFILLIGALTSVIFAVLSAKPKVTKQEVDIEDIKKQRKSILFFGNFVKLELEQFVNDMAKLKEDQEILYDNMSVDLYYLGVVLAKKYKLLSYSYLIFMSALILTVASFIFIFFYSFPTTY